jgi:hypothetical protein
MSSAPILRVASTRATASPILLFGVLAPAVMPTRIDPDGESHPDVSVSPFRAASQWRTVPRSGSMHVASSTWYVGTLVAQIAASEIVLLEL